MSTDGTASSEHGPDADALEMSVDISILEAQQADYEKTRRCITRFGLRRPTVPPPECVMAGPGCHAGHTTNGLACPLLSARCRTRSAVSSVQVPQQHSVFACQRLDYGAPAAHASAAGAANKHETWPSATDSVIQCICHDVNGFDGICRRRVVTSVQSASRGCGRECDVQGIGAAQCGADLACGS
jgi:hypothetical protein